jgi:hypothetical protein
MFVVFEAARREVSCPMQPADARHLPDGHLLPYPGTWFWYVHCEWTPQPYGPYLSREEAEAGARAQVVELMTGDREALQMMMMSKTRH